MFLKRLSAALVGIVCFGSIAVGAENFTQTSATNSGKGNPLVAPLDLSFLPVPVSPRCAGESNGRIDVTVFAGTGTAPYKYQIQKNGGALQPIVTNQPASFSINNLGAGVYKIYLTDANNFTSSQDATITENPSLLISLESSVVSPLCSGGTANILFQASGGNSSGYSFQLYKDGASEGFPNSNGDFTGKGAGNYVATVTDGSGCIKSSNTVQIFVPSQINFNYNIISEVNCDNSFATVQFFNLPTDPFEIEVRNTTLGKAYTSHTADYIYSNLEAGSYSVKVTRISCPTDNQTLTFNLESFSPISISTSPNSPVELSCGGENDLTDVSVTISGGRTGRQVHVVMDDNNIATVDQESNVSYGTPVLFTDLASGSYTIKWNDVLNPSCSGTQQYVISNPSSPLVWLNDPIGIASKCNGDATGVIQINVSGGTQPYSYFVDDIAATNPINRSAGTYTVFAQDSKGCETEVRTVAITQPDPVVVTHNPADDVHLTCPMGNNGEIHLNVTGGVGGFRYDLIYSSTGNIFRPNVPTSDPVIIGALSGNTYNVQIKDANNCPANLIPNIEIREPEPITLSQFELDTIKCFGEKANLNVQAIGGSSSTMTYKLYLGSALLKDVASAGVVTFDELEPGAYTLRVWSDLSCTTNFLNKTFVVVGRRQLVVDNIGDSIMMKCSGDMPSFTLTVQGEAPFSYSIDGSPYTPFIGNSILISSGLTSSVTGYLNEITVIDRYGCETPVNVKIFEPEALTVTNFETTPAKCYDKNNGTISLDISGGIPGYTISVLEAGTSNVLKTKPSSTGIDVTIPNIHAGVYDIKITDKNKCVAPNPITNIVIEEPDELTIEEPVYDEIKCFGSATEVTLTANGGWAVDKNILIKGGGVTNTIASGASYSLKAGTYTLTASNTDGCKTTKIITIDQPEKLVLKLEDVDNVSCNGEDDAKISFSVTGGIPDYQYGLNGAGSAGTDFGGNSYTIDGGIEEGTYKLVVRDANLCESNIVSVTITEPPVVTFDFRVDSLSCYLSEDGKITFLNVTGGNDNSYRSYINGVASTFPVINGLAAGTYDLLVTDSKGCPSVISTIPVGQPDIIILNQANITDSISCHNSQDATITVLAEGGGPNNYLMYRVAGPIVRTYQKNNIFTSLPPGEYEVWVRNNEKNCAVKFDKNLMIDNPQEITISKAPVVDVKCHNEQNGRIDIDALGGTGLLEYYIVGLASGANINPNNTGIFSGLGDPNKSFTAYNYIISDAKNCTLKGSFTVNNPDEITIKELDHFQVTCNDKKDGWIKVEVAGGNGDYKFKKDVSDAAVTSDVEQITANVFTIKKYDGGFFNPVVIDKKGCSDSIANAIEIINPDLLLIDNVEWGKKLCNGDMDDSTIIQVVGGTKGYYYSIDEGKTFGELNDSIFVGLKADEEYAAIVKDANGCLTPMSETFLMEQPDLFSVTYKFTGLSCYYDEYGDMELKILGGTGPYYLSLNDPLYVNDTWTLAKVKEDTTIVKLSDVGVKLSTDITYEFYLKDENGCNVQNIPGIKKIIQPIADTIFTKPEKLTLTSITPKPIKCSNEKTGVIEFTAKLGEKEFINEIPAGYTFTATNVERGYSKTNSPGSTRAIELFAGYYECQLVDKYGCIAATGINGFVYDPKSNSHFNGIDTTTIKATYDSLQVNFTTIKQPKCDFWFDGYIEVDVYNYYEDGVKYIVERWDSSESRFNMEQRDWTDTIPLFDGYQVPGTDLNWCLPQRIVEDISVGLYKITVRDLYTECIAVIDTIIFSVDGDSCPPINYYNAFTPLNGDGYNDEWEIIGSQYQSYTLQIYTALGELIFSEEGVSNNKGIKWNGLDKWGRPAPVGTYIYLLRKFEGTEKEELIDGNITILRSHGR